MDSIKTTRKGVLAILSIETSALLYCQELETYKERVQELEMDLEIAKAELEENHTALPEGQQMD